jgi:TonB family protein
MRILNRANLLIALCILSEALIATGQNVLRDGGAKVIEAPTFDISAEDEAADIDGTIKIAIDIDKTGKVTRARSYIGPSWPCSADLDKRIDNIMRDAEKAAFGFRFSPAILEGQPIESQLGVTLKIGKSARIKPEPEPPPPPPRKSGESAVPKTIYGGVVNGKATSLPIPSYPAAAREVGEGGSVVVQILIDEDGKVVRAQAIKGPRLLQMSARRAACGAKFSPTLLGGMPVKVSGVITYNFTFSTR